MERIFLVTEQVHIGIGEGTNKVILGAFLTEEKAKRAVYEYRIKNGPFKVSIESIEANRLFIDGI